jgi:hypothetical protein
MGLGRVQQVDRQLPAGTALVVDLQPAVEPATSVLIAGRTGEALFQRALYNEISLRFGAVLLHELHHRQAR